MVYYKFSLPKGVSESIKNKPQYQNWFKNLSFTTLLTKSNKVAISRMLGKINAIWKKNWREQTQCEENIFLNVEFSL